MIDAGGVSVMSKADVKGTVKGGGPTKYLVDFSKGLGKYRLTKRPEDYKNVIVNKNDCKELN